MRSAALHAPGFKFMPSPNAGCDCMTKLLFQAENVIYPAVLVCYLDLLKFTCKYIGVIIFELLNTHAHLPNRQLHTLQRGKTPKKWIS